MRLKIRNIDSVVVKKIDELAKRNSLSRSEYSKMLIENLAVSSSPKKEDVDFKLDTEKLNSMLGKVNSSLNNIEQKQEKLFAMVQLATEL